MVCDGGYSLFGENNTICTSKEADTSKEVSLEFKEEKTRRTFMSRHQCAGPDSNAMIAHEFLENVAKFPCRGTTYNIKTAFTRKLRAD
jgi:hypothetical protein